MFEVYFTDKVNPSVCVHKCNTLKEAKKWISEQLKGYTTANDCSEDEFYSSATAYYEVYDGEPISLNVLGEPVYANLIFESDYFYVD